MMFSFRTTTLLSISFALLIVCSFDSLGKDNTTDAPILSGQSGVIKIASLPPNAKVRLDGKYTGTTPIDLNGVPVGSHVIKLSLRGYPDYVTKINVEEEHDIVLNIALPKKVYDKWLEQYSQAITSSFVLPGKGQVDNGHTRGWYYFLTFGASTAYAIYSTNSYNKSKNRFNDDLDSYREEEITPEEAVRRFRNVTNARDDMIRAKDHYETALAVAVGIWALNMFDVVFFTVDRPVIFAATPQTLSLYTNPKERQIGLRLDF